MEAYAGGRGIVRRASAAHPTRTFAAVDDVVAAARAGDAACDSILADAAQYLGMALAAAVNLFNPAMLVVGGGVIRAWPELKRRAVAEMKARSLAAAGQSLIIRNSRLGAYAGVIGAAALARGRAEETPTPPTKSLTP